VLGRLRVRLVLAFAAVAALPLVALPYVLGSITQRLDVRFQHDLDAAAGQLRDELAAQAAEVKSRTERAARTLVPLLSDDGTGEPADRLSLSESALARHDLHALQVVDEDGRIALCGHIPARLDDSDPLGTKDWKAGGPRVITLDLPVGEELAPRRVLASVSKLDGHTIVGGTLLDEARLTRLGRVVRGDVTWLDAPPGNTKSNERRVEVVSGIEGPVLSVVLPDPALALAKRQVIRGAVLASGAALLAGVLLAWWLARRISRPVASLIEGARAVAEGRLGYQVQDPASGELAELVSGFNGMSLALARTQERLAQAERVAAWEQIARSLAHEIKNPLTPIKLSVETLQRAWERKHPEFDGYFREGSSTVLEEVRRLDRLASEFGEFARWPRPMRASASPAEIVNGVKGLWSSPPEGISITVELDDALPPVNADRDHLQRALGNLVKNAVEAMPRGGNIVLRARKAMRDGGGDVVRFEVQDSGGGIAPEVREKLFEPYVTTKATGTGLGLAIVQRIVTEHEGWLSAADASGGGGTIFRIDLPAEAPGTLTA